MYRPMLIGAILLGTTSASHAAVILVENGESIQAAIDSASAGDEVIVSPGVYNEALNTHGKAITLRSFDPADPDVVSSTVLDGAGLETSILTVDSDEWLDTVISGLTFRNGEGTAYGDYRHGGAINLEQSMPSIRRCVFADNHADFGGAIASQYSWAVISNCHFESNSASGPNWRGGAALGVYHGYLKVVNSSFIENSTAYPTRGGAISIADGWPSSIVGCVFAGNDAAVGGALAIDGTDVEIINSTIARNAAELTAGGIHLIGSSNVDLLNSIVTENGAEDISSGTGGSVSASASLIGGDAHFVNADAHDYRLRATSPAVDNGEINLMPYDFGDVDEDGDEWEALPLDLDGNPRIALGGPSNSDTVDLGAYEFSGEPAPACPYDLNNDASVNFDDLIVLIEAWGDVESDEPADFNDDGVVSMADLTVLLTSWGPCP